MKKLLIGLIFYSLSVNSYALNCTNKNLKKLYDVEHKMTKLYNTSLKLLKKSIALNNSIQWREDKLSSLNKAFKELKKVMVLADQVEKKVKEARRKYKIVKKNAYVLHEACNGKVSDKMYQLYEETIDWARDNNLYGKKDILDQAIVVYNTALGSKKSVQKTYKALKKKLNSASEK